LAYNNRYFDWVEEKRGFMHWQQSLINAITDPKELLELLELDLNLLEPAKKSAQQFSLKVPRGFVARMRKKDINDPLLKQVLPLGCELSEFDGFTQDPLGEANVNPTPGLLHKYHSRVLLTLIGTCGVNCRYCFRRHFPYEKNNPGSAGWEKTLEYIAQDATIKEVILSGGDPLVASDNLLKTFSDKLIAIPHIKRLRIHSRMPIVLPERITPEFIDWISTLPLKTILITHVNHPQEIDSSVKTAMQELLKAGVVLLNQSVLLKGINDNVDTLVELSETLFDAGIQPYYLNTLDKVRGSAHFDLDYDIATQLHWELTQRLSGYLVPRLVSEIPGAPAKISKSHREFYTG
jgi:EF-P beta-lysylation protein EpmB